MISEKTKQIASSKKASLRQQRKKNLGAIQTHRNAIDKLQAINTELKIQYDALEMDIPEPTPAPPIEV